MFMCGKYLLLFSECLWVSFHLLNKWSVCNKHNSNLRIPKHLILFDARDKIKQWRGIVFIIFVRVTICIEFSHENCVCCHFWLHISYFIRLMNTFIKSINELVSMMKQTQQYPILKLHSIRNRNARILFNQLNIPFERMQRIECQALPHDNAINTRLHRIWFT